MAIFDPSLRKIEINRVPRFLVFSWSCKFLRLEISQSSFFLSRRKPSDINTISCSGFWTADFISYFLIIFFLHVFTFSFLLYFEIPKNFLPSFPLIILQHLLTVVFLLWFSLGFISYSFSFHLPFFFFLLIFFLFFFFLFSRSAPIPTTSGGDRDRSWVRSGRRLTSGSGGVWPVVWWSPFVSHFPLLFSFFFVSSSSFFFLKIYYWYNNNYYYYICIYIYFNSYSMRIFFSFFLYFLCWYWLYFFP